MEFGPLRASTTSRWRDAGGIVEWYWKIRKKTTREEAKPFWGSRDAVQQHLAELAATWASACAPSAGPAIPTTIGDLVARYIEHRGRDLWQGNPREKPKGRHILVPGSMVKYTTSARHLASWLADVPLTAVNDRLLVEYSVNRRLHDQRPSRSDRTLKSELDVLVFAWAWAADNGWVRGKLRNPVLPDPARHINDRTSPTPGDLRAVLERLTGPYRLAVELIAWTGARRGEVIERLLVRDCDVAEGVLQDRKSVV